MKKLILRLIIVAAVLGAAWGGYYLVRQLPQRQQQVPTAVVRQGDVIIRAYSRGELRAVRSVTLTTPNLFGTVQVTRLAPLGAFAREKDLIVEFDDSEVLSRLEEKQLELEQIDEQIRKAQSELAIRNNQDEVELLRARYSVRRSELEVKRNELLSAIDAKKNLLTLEESRRRLKQLESDIKSRREQAQAELAVLREQRNKAVIEMNREKERLSQTRLLSPMSGLVAIHQNRFTGGRMFGMQVPDIREGDQVQPGMPVADVLDLSELEIVAKVGELDRANLSEGQEVIIQLDALPEKGLNGKIKSMSGTASANIFSGDPSKKFDVTFSIDMEKLLSAVGARPEQIRRVLETAARNRTRPQAQFAAASFSAMRGGMMGGAGGEGFAGGPGMGAVGFQRPGGEEASGGPAAESSGRRGARGGASGGAQLSDEQRQKMREALQKELGGRNMQDLSQEDRQKIFAKLRGQLQLPAASARQGQSGAEGTAQPRVRRQRAEGSGAPGESPAPAAPARRAGSFTEKELAEAKLPLPPEEDSQLEVLLRPGLLADVEIIVEKIPNAIHVPAQAIFEKEGKPVVYVKSDNRFVERPVKLLKQSESTMVIADGLKPGEVIALADPNPRRQEKKEETPQGGSSPMGPPSGGRS